jgi:hypothetical protein
LARNSSREFGLKISPAQREYYRYSEASAELQQRGVHSLPRPDFSRGPRTVDVRESEFSTLQTNQPPKSERKTKQ